MYNIGFGEHDFGAVLTSPAKFVSDEPLTTWLIIRIVRNAMKRWGFSLKDLADSCDVTYAEIRQIVHHSDNRPKEKMTAKIIMVLSGIEGLGKGPRDIRRSFGKSYEQLCEWLGCDQDISSWSVCDVNRWQE